jgi:hypothetical protein
MHMAMLALSLSYEIVIAFLPLLPLYVIPSIRNWCDNFNDYNADG